LEQVLVTFSPQVAQDREQLRVGVLCGRLRKIHLVERQLATRLGIVPSGLEPHEFSVLEQMMKASQQFLGQVCTTQRGTGLQKFASTSGKIAVIGGKDLSEFRRPTCTRFVPDTIDRNLLRVTQPPQAVFQNLVAHITRPAPHIRLIGTVVEEEFACLDTVNLLSPISSDLSAFALVGLLMSDLINWFVYVCVYNRAIRTMHFDGYFLAKIPAPVGDLNLIDSVARQIQALPESPAAWSRLNMVIYDSYGIPPETRQYISSLHKPRWKT
jgi:hypothetical protein